MRAGGYTAPMRFTLVAVAVAMVMAAAGGCTTAIEKERLEKDERISAARLGGKFHHEDPLVQMLSSSERDALVRSGMMAPIPEGEELAEGDLGDEERSTADKAGDVMMSVLAVSVTLGMMAAPYLLF